MDLDTYSLLVERIYDAATNSKLWPLALRTMTDAFGGCATSLIFRDMSTMEGRWISTLGSGTETEYFNTWRHNNVLVDRKQNWRPWVVETDRDFMPKADLLCSDFYAGFMRPRGIYATMRTLLRREGTVQPSLNIARHGAAGDFDNAEVEFARRLTPHVQHAISISYRLRDTNLNAGDAAEILDRLGHMIVVLDDAGAPVHFNRAAERLFAMSDGLTMEPDGLRAATPAVTARLAAIVTRASGSCGEVPAAGAMALARPSGRRPLALIALPMRGQPGWLPSIRRMVLVCITDPAATAGISAAQLAALFQLTPAEVEVAQELLADRNAGEIAMRLQSSVHTVRTHLSHLMAKTETRRQGELIRLLASLTLMEDAGAGAVDACEQMPRNGRVSGADHAVALARQTSRARSGKLSS